MTGNGIGEKGLDTLFEPFMVNRTLKKLNLSCKGQRNGRVEKIVNEI